MRRFGSAEEAHSFFENPDLHQAMWRGDVRSALPVAPTSATKWCDWKIHRALTKNTSSGASSFAMHLRVTRGSFDPTKSDDVLKETQAVNAVITRRPGCQALQGGMDRKSGVLVVISTWDDGAAANFSRESLGEPFERMVALGVQFQPPEVYEAID